MSTVLTEALRRLGLEFDAFLSSSFSGTDPGNVVGRKEGVRYKGVRYKGASPRHHRTEALRPSLEFDSFSSSRWSSSFSGTETGILQAGRREQEGVRLLTETFWL